MTARLALIVLLIAGAAGTSGAQQLDPQREALIEQQMRQLSAELRCPVCQALSLADSPSELSQEMKDVVRAQLEAGRTPEEVKAYFVERYGEWILLRPKPRGWNLLVYILPALAAVAGLGGVILLLRRWTSNSAGPGATPQS
jgi:cytochrome c-type biogenesis protein CcmH